MKIASIGAAFASLLLVACTAPLPHEPIKAHISAENAKPLSAGDIPAPVEQSLALPKPRPVAKTETYSVVVNNVAVRDLLFALARDARINVDIHPGIGGNVTLNAIDQTLPQLLSRISKQADMRFELDGPNLVVLPDTPFLKHYKVDYVNMARNVAGAVAANTQINTGVAGTTGAAAQSGGSAGNVSSIRIENASKNQFWESLDKNIKDILRETDKILPEGSSETVYEQSASQNATGAAALPHSNGQRAAQAVANALGVNPTPSSASQGTGNTIVRHSTFREAASVITNPESGIVTVRATQRQHEKVQEFIGRVTQSALRQVMIEATIVEVQLDNGYEQGIDWTRLIGAGTFRITPVSGVLSSNTATNLTYTGNTITTAIKLLETFGNVKVVSSPRLSVLNNQTALLKVVTNVVYFNIKADTTTTANVGAQTTVTTTPQSVPIGLVMSVTPQISDNGAITLNVRPTISRISGFKNDPNPSIPTGLLNQVPEIQTKEIESVMRVASGEIAVLGGLMEDGINYQTGRVPGFSLVPLLGELLNTRNNATTKSELVIFLRPVVIKDASLNGDFSGMRDYLPREGAFATPPEAKPFNIAPRL